MTSLHTLIQKLSFKPLFDFKKNKVDLTDHLLNDAIKKICLIFLAGGLSFGLNFLMNQFLDKSYINFFITILPLLLVTPYALSDIKLEKQQQALHLHYFKQFADQTVHWLRQDNDHLVQLFKAFEDHTCLQAHFDLSSKFSQIRTALHKMKTQNKKQQNLSKISIAEIVEPMLQKFMELEIKKSSTPSTQFQSYQTILDDDKELFFTTHAPPISLSVNAKRNATK